MDARVSRASLPLTRLRQGSNPLYSWGEKGELEGLPLQKSPHARCKVERTSLKPYLRRRYFTYFLAWIFAQPGENPRQKEEKVPRLRMLSRSKGSLSKGCRRW